MEGFRGYEASLPVRIRFRELALGTGRQPFAVPGGALTWGLGARNLGVQIGLMPPVRDESRISKRKDGL